MLAHHKFEPTSHILTYLNLCALKNYVKVFNALGAYLTMLK